MTGMSQLQRLAAPFPERYVSSVSKGGHSERYVTFSQIVQAMLAVVGPHSVAVDEVRGLAPAFTSKGTSPATYPAVENAITGAKVTITARIDGELVSVTGCGDVELPAMKDSDGERLKLASTDGYKRSAMLMGCGLHMWVKDEKDFWLPASLAKQAEQVMAALVPGATDLANLTVTIPAPADYPTTDDKAAPDPYPLADTSEPFTHADDPF